MLTLVRAIYDEHRQLLEYLRAKNERSFANSLASTLPKVLLLASTSHLEQEMQELILDYFRDVISNRECAIFFVQRKAVVRQFHTYCDWDSGNANKFFSLFGDKFKTSMSALLRTDDMLASAVRDFVALGSLRNQLVHQNYVAFNDAKHCRRDLGYVRERVEVCRAASVLAESAQVASVIESGVVPLGHDLCTSTQDGPRWPVL